MKFLFIYPPGDEDSLETDKTSSPFAPPLGLMYVSSIAREQGDYTEILDIRADRIFQKDLKRMIKSSDAVGISIPTFSLKNSKIIVDSIREIDKDIFIFAGGPHCTLFPKDSIRMLGINAAIEGEGEYPMMSLSKHICDGKIEKVPGVYYKEGDRIKKGEPLKSFENLDMIPFPSHDLIKRYDYGYISDFKPFKGKFTAMISSRGCPYRCKFCSRDIFIGRRYRQRSPENVLDEIEEVVKQGYNGIIFVDDNFLLNKKRTMDIMDGIVERGFDITIIVEGARVDAADSELYKKMWNAGVRLISYGIESGNQDVLDFYNKRITINQIKKAVKLSNVTGFFTVASFILGAPFETEEHFKNTIDLARSLPLDFVEFYILEYRVGSQLWSDAVRDGIIKKNNYFVKSCKENNLGNFSLSELEEWRKKAYTKFYMRPSYLLRESFRLLKIGNLDFIKSAIPIFTKIGLKI